MTWKVLVAHAEGEEALAEKLAEPLRQAGYDVAHRGTVMVGESVVEEASKVLSIGGPVVLCGTVKAVGTGWAYRLVNAARQHHQKVRVFAMQIEKDAYVEMLSPDGTIALYWQDPAKAVEDLIASLQKYYPLDDASRHVLLEHDAEERYRELVLESCDIIDLANLPESDRHLATRQLELRRLYVPLRVRVEVAPDAETGEAAFEEIEKRRSTAQWGRLDGSEQENGSVRVPVGERLAEARRLVVLGDPGAGKTTMARWIATAYLLRLKRDPDWKDLPDVATLPDEDWLPIIVRCRDLDPSCVDSLNNVLGHVLRKAEMTETESNSLRDVLQERLRHNQALLLIDGLDEIAEPALRARFCQQIEQFHIAYPDTPIIATSRIVGYREMSFRIGRGFEHVTIADLSEEDKDDFARRWCAVTELPERREAATQELIDNIHSTDRIERLTGNPMLLTTMALVKRKVGKLPSRRADLYWEAVQVLLNWRSEVDEPIDHREAVPQLEYVAYVMCDRGVQQLREDEIIGLFERMREEYPSVHTLRNHTPEEFLRLLERRTGIMVEAGHVRHRGRPVPIFEFRHLTFQEYLAGLALVDGRFPGRDRSRSLADYVAPLAGQASEWGDSRLRGTVEVAVAENWREALRLCVACCGDDDVDDALLAILNPLEEEDAETTARSRAVLAALCLADEPNASETTAQTVLREFARQTGEYDGSGNLNTSVDAAAMELASSRWAGTLHYVLIEEFRQRDVEDRMSVGGLCAKVSEVSVSQDEDATHEWLTEQVSRIMSGDEVAAIDAALGIMALAHSQRVDIVAGMTEGLLAMLAGSGPMTHAAAWALGWLNDERLGENAWRPSSTEMESIISFVDDLNSDTTAVRLLIWVLARESDTHAVEPLIARLHDPNRYVRREAAGALGQIGDARAIEPLIAKLEDEDDAVQLAAAWALGQIGDARAVEPLISRLEGEDSDVQQAIAGALGEIGDARAVESLIAKLEDQDSDVRRTAMGGLLRMCKDEMDRKLLTKDLDGYAPYLDPQDEIGKEWVREAAEELELSVEEVYRRYEALTQQFPLKLAWQPRAAGSMSSAENE